MEKGAILKHLPDQATESLQRLSERLVQARRRRGWSQQKMAGLLLVGLNTYRRMEQGSPAIAIGFWLQAFFVLGTLKELDGLLLYDNDRLGAALSQRKRDARMGKPTIHDLADML
ncbi:MAG: helix-turn-helix domain-containing protein [Acidithiobacillus sp.]